MTDPFIHHILQIEFPYLLSFQIQCSKKQIQDSPLQPSILKDITLSTFCSPSCQTAKAVEEALSTVTHIIYFRKAFH